MSAHVLVARMDNDGDVLLAGPAVRAVAAGARRVTLLCGPRGLQAARLLPGVDEVICHRAPWIDPEPDPVDADQTLELVRRLAAARLDQAIVLTSFHQSALPLALLLRLAGVPEVAAISDDYPGSLLSVRHRVEEELHEVERSLSLVATLGYAPPSGDDLRLAVRALSGEPPVDRVGQAELVRRDPRDAPARAAPEQAPYVVVHPGASVSARAWGAARNAELVDALVARGRRVVVTGGPAERALTARVSGSHASDVSDLGGRTDMATLAQVLAGAQAVVVGNTGPAHLAAAVGTPVVCLFAPTVPVVRWRPWGVAHEILYQPVPCAGCRARTCPVPGHPCLEGLSVATVLDALERLSPGDGERSASSAVAA